MQAPIKQTNFNGKPITSGKTFCFVSRTSLDSYAAHAHLTVKF